MANIVTPLQLVISKGRIVSMVETAIDVSTDVEVTVEVSIDDVEGDTTTL
jgi:hypothetical protein